MPVQAQAIITRVRTQLIDDLPTQRWTDTELLSWLSDGQRTLVSVNPTLGAVTAPMPLVVGTKQVLPAGAFMLVEITRNLGLDGKTPGRVVTPIGRDNLDRTDPNWHVSRRSEVTQHYIYNPDIPLVFYVYPPSTGFNFLEVSCAQNPADITALTGNIAVPDLYQTALFDFTMFRAHQKDSDYAAGDQVAQGYLQLFQMFASAHDSAIEGEAPNKLTSNTELTPRGAAA